MLTGFTELIQVFVPSREKTNNLCFRSDQTYKLVHTVVEISDLRRGGLYNLCSENKDVHQLCVTVQLICVFVFVYADCLFSHAAAYLWRFCDNSFSII